MQVETVETAAAEVEADALVVALVAGDDLSTTGPALGEATSARLRRLVEDGEIRGKRGEITILHTDGEIAARRVVVAGLGDREKIDADGVRTAAANVARRIGSVGTKTIAWMLEDGTLPRDEQARAVVDGAVLGPYEHGRWRSDFEEAIPDRLILCGAGARQAGEVAGVAAVVARWTNRCRTLVDAPANELTPAALAAAAREIAEGAGISFEELDRDQIEGAGMNLLAAVARGAEVPPRLIVLRYEPDGARSDLHLGLVGKAITFDSGGLSLKTAAGMEDMKSDMAGGAAVLCALGAVAELNLPLRVLAVIPACENMIAGGSVRPGDIVTSLNGKTVEITNTDAEGRLALADALVYARRLGATHVVDIATLTGGIVVALGDVYAGLFANDEDWGNKIRAAGEASGDLVWPWPLHPSYDRYTESPFADLKNSTVLRQGTPVYAARFLHEFAGEGPWAHLDIAGLGYLDRGRGDYYASLGATGFGVRLLAELVRDLAA